MSFLNFDNINIINIIILGFSIIILIISYYNKRKSKKIKTFNIDSFTICNHILRQILDDYKEIVYCVKVKHLQITHDIDPKSKTNAIESFNDKQNNLLKVSSKDILNMLSKSTYEQLLNYYTRDNLILYIINFLKR